MLASACLLDTIIILTLAMSTKFRTLITLLTYSISIVGQKDFEPVGCLFECILVASASSTPVERVLFLRVGIYYIVNTCFEIAMTS